MAPDVNVGNPIASTCSKSRPAPEVQRAPATLRAPQEQPQYRQPQQNRQPQYRQPRQYRDQQYRDPQNRPNRQNAPRAERQRNAPNAHPQRPAPQHDSRPTNSDPR